MNKSLFAKPICVQRLARFPQKVLSPLCVKQFITFLIALAAMTVSTTSAWAQTASIKYLDYDQYPYYKTFSEASHDATKITSSSTSLSGWYYVEGNVTINGKVTLTDHTYLILCDDATLTIDNTSGDGIDLDLRDLTIYAQSSGDHKGKLIIKSYNVGMGIGRDVTINGGDISVTPTTSDGIICNHFILNGGIVTVDSPSTLSGINAQGGFTINGGKVSATGTRDGIFGHYVTINGGQVTATGDTGGTFAGIRSGSDDIDLGWTNATDFIKANSYSSATSIDALKNFYIDGTTPLNAGNGISASSINDKTLTPNTTTPSYTITLATGITGGSIAVDKTKAFEYERVAITATPETGKMLTSLSYTYGSTTVNILASKQANDYVFTMPDADVTSINATFETVVAKIGTTEYPSLASAFAAVADGETINIISDKDESSASYDFSTHGSTRSVTINMNSHTYSFGNISNKYSDLNIIGPGTFNFGSFENQGQFLFKDVTVNCKFINNPGAAADITFDNAKVVCNSAVAGNSSIQLYGADQGIVLKNGSDVEINQMMYVGYNDNFTLDIQDAASILKLRSCAISFMVRSYVEDQFLQYIRPDQKTAFSSDLANGNAITLDLRASWGIMLASDLGEISPGVPKATVTFYDGGTSFDPTAFNPSNYTTSTTFIDNSDGNDHYVIAHIVPELFYWTDLSLLSAVETGASLTGDANTITLLKRDQYNAANAGDPADMRDRYDGAGWYYYMLPKGHSVAAGYVTSTLGGEVVHKFDLADENTAFSQDFVNNTLTISRTTDTWKATLTYDKLSWKFGGSFALSDLPKLQSISFKKGDTEKFLQNDADALAGQIKNAYEIEQVRIGDNPLMLLYIVNGCFVQSDYSRPKYKVLVPFDGEGSSGNPWQINTAADLSMLAKCVNVAAYTFNGETLAMGNNETYDMSGFDFEPIGTDSNLPFCGTLLGNGSTIKNISYVFAGPSAVSDETQYGIGFIGNLGEIGEPRRSGNVDNIKLENCSFSSSDNDICYVGSIAGAANRGSVSNCYVIGGNVSAPKAGSYAGAIVGKLGAATLKYNYYDYTTTATLGSSTASGYTKRGICTETISVDPGTPSTYDWNDFPTNDGAMLWVKKASITGGTSANGSTVAFNKVTKGTDRYDMAGDDFYYAVGQTVTLDVNLGNRTDDIRTFCDELTALTVSDGTTNTDIKDALSFTMPGADATVTATIAESDWFTINTVNYNAADPTAPFAYNWMTFYHEWTMKDPTSGNNVAGKFVVTNYDDPTAAVEVKTITAVDPTAGTYTSAAINGSYSDVPTLFHYADNNNGVLPQKLKFTPDFNIELNQTADRRFKGTATALALSASAKCYILNNAGDFILAYVTPTDNTIAAHRCYVDLSGDNSNQARLISSGDATGIDSMVNGQGTMDNLDGDWFSLDGRRLNGQPTRKGIYIHHGKKTVIK